MAQKTFSSAYFVSIEPFEKVMVTNDEQFLKAALFIAFTLAGMLMDLMDTRKMHILLSFPHLRKLLSTSENFDKIHCR